MSIVAFSFVVVVKTRTRRCSPRAPATTGDHDGQPARRACSDRGQPRLQPIGAPGRPCCRHAGRTSASTASRFVEAAPDCRSSRARLRGRSRDAEPSSSPPGVWFRMLVRSDACGGPITQDSREGDCLECRTRHVSASAARRTPGVRTSAGVAPRTCRAVTWRRMLEVPSAPSKSVRALAHYAGQPQPRSSPRRTAG